ncbi:helix-turn-helix domain-containing protein [Allosphingosinicella deserti]|uniref:LuxR family transcriptional regulator n=1 Tax=Allosphingosinicella deserti TaxID=2116704 RepID=A0A2P7QY25_9SPHN|nr:DUF4019 domain-containing protein [Sphingomonas deserti]PSJ42867.1 LuxR family transcriptional regulator [Sphingomonas deserti]
MNDGFPALGEREKETLRLLLAGHDAKSIAASLGLSVHTVNERLRDARRKLGVSSSREAARRLAALEGQDPNPLGDKEFGVVPSGKDMEGPGGPHRRRGGAIGFVWFGGGMFIMSLIIAGAVLTFALQGNDGASPVRGTQAAAAATAAAETQSRGLVPARAWMALIDRGAWDQSWEAAGSQFRSQLTKAQWASTVEAVLQPLGQMSSRTLVSVAPTTSLPGAPAGVYEVIQFRTAYARKPEAFETVIVVREPSGWKVVGYFVR